MVSKMLNKTVKLKWGLTEVRHFLTQEVLMKKVVENCSEFNFALSLNFFQQKRLEINVPM